MEQTLHCSVCGTAFTQNVPVTPIARAWCPDCAPRYHPAVMQTVQEAVTARIEQETGRRPAFVNMRCSVALHLTLGGTVVEEIPRQLRLF